VEEYDNESPESNPKSLSSPDHFSSEFRQDTGTSNSSASKFKLGLRQSLPEKEDSDVESNTSSEEEGDEHVHQVEGASDEEEQK